MSKSFKSLARSLAKVVEPTSNDPLILNKCSYLNLFQNNNFEIIPSTYNYYDDHSLCKIFIHNKYGAPDCFSIYNLDCKVLDYFNNSDFAIVKKSFSEDGQDFILFKEDKLFTIAIDGKKISISVFGRNLKNEELQKTFEKYKREPTKDKIEIGMVQSDQFGLNINWFEIDVPKVDIALNYGSEFATNHYPKILEALKQENRIFLFHSEPGAGKTFFIKHLVEKADRKFIYISDSILSRGLDSPEFIDLLVENRGCVLIIEDGEKFIISREENPNSLVSNLLNVADGILGDIMGFSLILTHNMDKLENIDKALLRKSRLAYQYRFGKLSTEDSNKKLESLGENFRTNKPMTLAEIYNLEDNNAVKKEERVIGFR